MTHPIAASDGSPMDHLDRMWSTLLDPTTPAPERLQRVLEREAETLALPHAYFARTGESYEVIVALGGHPDLRPGNRLPLELTYCSETIEHPERRLCVSDANTEGWADHPAARSLGIESYAGVAVSDTEGVYGTVCFMRTDARVEPITDAELALIAQIGRWVSYELQTAGAAHFETATDGPTDPEAFDALLAVLAEGDRRRIVAGIDAEDIRSVEALRERLGEGGTRIDLVHRHLPKLAAAGVIAWDRGDGTLNPGPAFAQARTIATGPERMRVPVR